MSFFYAIILGIVQGLTEFLPVSSSGHIILVDKLFGITQSNLIMSVLLHVATLLAVVITFRKDIWELIRHPFSKESQLIYISFIPTVIMVLIIKFLSPACFDGAYLGFFFILTAVVLLISDLFSQKNNSFKPFTKSSAFIMGLGQGFACIPGLSRSGTTIATGLIMGENREQVAHFSFIMSIPVILASMFYEIIFDGGFIAIKENILPVICSFLVALLVGLMSIKFMLKLVKKHKFYWFSIYLVIVGTLTIIFL